MNQAIKDIYTRGAFEKTPFSSKALATGNTEIVLFDGKNEVFNTTYKTGGVNIFENGRGAILEVGAKITSAAGADLALGTDAVRAALSKIHTFGIIEIKRNTLPVYHRGLEFLMNVPSVVKTAVDTPASITGPSISAKMEDLAEIAIPFENSDDNMSVVLKMPALEAGLNAAIFTLFLKTLEVRPK